MADIYTVFPSYKNTLLMNVDIQVQVVVLWVMTPSSAHHDLNPSSPWKPQISN
jgi:hypothetical protein